MDLKDKLPLVITPSKYIDWLTPKTFFCKQMKKMEMVLYGP